jgi:cystathionine gamma-synthase
VHKRVDQQNEVSMGDHPTDPRSLVRRSAMPESVSRPVVTPLSPSVVYRSSDPDELDAQYEGRLTGYTYAREGHPNATVLGEKIDWMEGMTPAMGKGVVTGSGMAAVSAMFAALLETGDHVVAGDQLYGRSLRLLRQDLPRLGIAATFADPTDAAAIEAAIRPETKLILVEVVSNPTLRVADMEGIAEVARRRGVMLAVDNTFTTPRGWQPFAHGANVVIHSVTKLLAGHSDVTLGWVAADTPERNKALYDTVVTWGMTPSPFDCWLAERGLHSFALRYDRAEANAAVLAGRLAATAGVAQVLYPGRPDHPDHNRATALLAGRHGNMVSFRLEGGRPAVTAFVHAARHIPFAPTLGDVGTTLSHPASSSHRGLTPEARAAIGIDEGFIRVSVGIEDIDQLSGEMIAAIGAARG